MTIDEQVECEQAVLASPEFKAALKKHYGRRRHQPGHGRHLERGQLRRRGRPHAAAGPAALLPPHRPDRQRLRPADRGPAAGRRSEHDEGHPRRGIRPLAAAAGRGQLRRRPRVGSSATDIKPLEITQPEGPSFEVDGYQVRWQKWSFVIGFNAREGLTLHHLRYDDDGRERSILYRASLTEMVVPYGDPGPTQRRKNAFDVGEYGMGMCANSLELGCDCLGLIRYFDAHLCDSRGEPLTIKNAVCMHEEDYGILWKHTDRRLPDTPEVRRSRRLVVSSISTVENYEYGFFWYLYQDGNIQFEIKLTGILSLGALPAGREAAVRRPRRAAALCAESSALLQRAARLRPRRRRQHRPPGRRRGRPARRRRTRSRTPSRREATPLKTEKQARGQPQPGDGADLEDRQPEREERASASRSATSSCRATTRSRSPRRTPGGASGPGSSNHHVWVTPYRRRRAATAAGDYPNQSQGGDGLIALDRAGPADRRTPTSCSGTPSATRTSRGRRTTR